MPLVIKLIHPLYRIMSVPRSQGQMVGRSPWPLSLPFIADWTFLPPNLLFWSFWPLHIWTMGMCHSDLQTWYPITVTVRHYDKTVRFESLPNPFSDPEWQNAHRPFYHSRLSWDLIKLRSAHRSSFITVQSLSYIVTTVIAVHWA